MGGDSWLITDEGFFDFLLEYPYEIDLRKVDNVWFMNLMAGRISNEGRWPHERRNTGKNRRGTPPPRFSFSRCSTPTE